MEVILMNGEVAGTRNPTGHMILLDCRFELPFGDFYFVDYFIQLVDKYIITVDLKCAI